MESLEKRIREYTKTTNNYVASIGNKIGHEIGGYVINAGKEVWHEIKRLGYEIKEKVETAKYYAPFALISSTIYGRMGYYGSMLLVYGLSRGGIGGGWYSKIPTIVGVATSIAALIMGLYDFHQIQVSQHQLHDINNTYNASITIIKRELNDINASITGLETRLNDMDNYYNVSLTVIGKELQYINNSLIKLQIQLNDLQNKTAIIQNEYLTLLNQFQTLENQYTLEKILFGSNNSYNISLIQINSVQIDNGTAYAQGTVYPSGDNVILKIPIGYVEKSNNNVTVTIQDLFNVAQKNGWNTDIIVYRKDIPYLNESVQNSTPIIAFQPHKPIKIGIIATPYDSSTVYYTLSHLNNYYKVIQDSYSVYDLSNALWGYQSGKSVVTVFSDPSQYNQALNMINIADQILKTPGNQNPTSSGIIYTYSIFDGTKSTYQNFIEYIVGQTYMPFIVLKPEKGGSII
jgi:hypothetical protein